MDTIYNFLTNGGGKISGGAACLILALLGLKLLREVLAEFRAYSFLRVQDNNVYKQHFLFEKCFEAALVILKQKRDIKKLNEGEMHQQFMELLQGIVNDIFPQNGLSPGDYKVEKMGEMELYKRYKTLKLPKEVI